MPKSDGYFKKGNTLGQKIKPGEVKNPNGKPKRLISHLKGLPKDMQEKVVGILAYALTLPDKAAAKQYLECQEGELGKYGFVLQIALSQLTKDGWGWAALMDIMDRLFGKPRQTAEVTHSGGITLIVNTDKETKELIEGGLG